MPCFNHKKLYRQTYFISQQNVTIKESRKINDGK